MLEQHCSEIGATLSSDDSRVLQNSLHIFMEEMQSSLEGVYKAARARHRRLPEPVLARVAHAVRCCDVRCCAELLL